MSNGCKFVQGPGGSVTLECELLARTAHTATYRFTVSDTGCGIPVAMQQKIFQKYQQVGVRRGTGMGLPLARGFVELMGGRLGVTSPYAQDGSPGAQFHFTVTFQKAGPPRKHYARSQRSHASSVSQRSRASAAPEEHSPRAVVVKAGAPPLPGNWRVLIADDEELIRMTIRLIIYKVNKNWIIDEVGKAEDAVTAAKATKYDLHVGNWRCVHFIDAGVQILIALATFVLQDFYGSVLRSSAEHEGDRGNGDSPKGGREGVHHRVHGRFAPGAQRERTRGGAGSRARKTIYGQQQAAKNPAGVAARPRWRRRWG